MPDKNRNSSGGGENSSKSSGKKQRPRNRNKQSNNGVKSSSDKTDGNSTTSSSRNPSKSSPEISNARKVEILKRDPKAPPLLSLMDIQTSKAPFQKNQNPASNGTTIETIKAQTRAYYFSENPGSAVSADTVTHQYTMQNFPLERNVNTMIDGKFSLMITPTTSRCNGLYILVKSQNSEDAQYEKYGQSATGALVKLDSSEKTIRKACRETMENFYEVSTACRSKRHPFSKSSEAYLTSCFIKRLEERLETFPDAIYYCEKCDYHISTISHAKAHLESSTHFDDIERQDQREIPSDAENQVSEVPKVTPNVQEPETANVFSINCVITQPQQIQADAVETPDESLKALENAREEAEKFPEPVQEIETTRVHFVNCVIARPIPEAVETPEESSLKASENAPEEAGAVPKLETSDEPLKALDNDTENAKDVPKLESLEDKKKSSFVRKFFCSGGGGLFDTEKNEFMKKKKHK